MEQQLSFEEFSSQEEITAKQELIPYTDYHLINAKEFTFPKRRFFILSVVAHIILAAWALTIVVQKLKPEIVEVEYIASATPAAAPAPIAYSEVETVPDVPETKMEPQIPEEIVKPVPQSKVAPIKAKVPTKVSAKPVVVKTAAPKASTSFTAEPMATVSDIEVPALSETQNANTPSLSTQEIESDFDKIDETQNAQLLAAAQTDSKMLEDSMTELEQQSNALAAEPSDIENATNEKLQMLKSQKENLKKSAQAAGTSGAPDVSAHTLAAERAKKASTYGNGSLEKSENQIGSEGTIGSQSEGIVRKLEDLRQKPGNPRPEYDVQDRMNGLSGLIIVNAYVTKDGDLTLFRLIKSTNHRNLDRKTLAVLKNWKFYPGQEGWVELPFRWDLKGGVQQKPTLLKRQ